MKIIFLQFFFYFQLQYIKTIEKNINLIFFQIKYIFKTHQKNKSITSLSNTH